MANNIRERSRRQHQKKTNQDFVYEKITNTKKNTENPQLFPCKGCDEVFRKKNLLLQHQAQCLTLKVNLSSKPVSFFGDHFSKSKPHVDEEEKTLPASQPLSEYRQEDAPTRRSYSHVVSPPEAASPTNITSTSKVVEQVSLPVNGNVLDDGNVPNDGNVPVTFICSDSLQSIYGNFEADNRIKPYLPKYEEVIRIPSMAYNGVDVETFEHFLSSKYEEIVRWRKNHFQVPTGQAGKQYISLKTQWLKKYNENTCFKAIALKVDAVLPSLLLQKPSAKSKAKEHEKLLGDRLKKWDEDKFDEIWNEALTIQNKIKSGR